MSEWLTPEAAATSRNETLPKPSAANRRGAFASTSLITAARPEGRDRFVRRPVRAAAGLGPDLVPCRSCFPIFIGVTLA